MAKSATKEPALDLFGQLQQAVEQADANRAAAQAVAASAAQKVADAKAAYEQIVAAATDERNAANATADASDAVVKKLQDDLNHVLGRFDTRVRVG